MLKIQLNNLRVPAFIMFLFFFIIPHKGYAEINLEPNRKQEVVILLHGLGRTDHSMRKIQSTLEKEGYIVNNINYPSKKFPIDLLVDNYVKPVVLQYSQKEAIHFVTHSLGGILVRSYLDKNVLSNLGSVVMLGPPNKGSEIVNTLRKYRFFRWYLGPSFLQLSTDKGSVPNQLGKPNYSIGIIAGTKPSNPFPSQFIKGENDGKVSVHSSKIEGRPLIKINVSHTWMMVNADVIKNLVNFLKYGEFLAEKGVASK